MKKLFLIVLVACYALAYEDTDSGSVSFEIGIGYLNSSFTGKQNSYLWNSRNKGYAKGIDIYVAANSYATERFGISFGMGAEFLNGSWNDECRVGSGMGMYDYNYAIEVLNFYLAKDPNSPNYTKQKTAIEKVAGTDYDKPFDGSKGYLSKTETTQYVFKPKSGGEYVEKTDTAGGKYYELAKEGETGTHELTTESVYLYRYNGNVLNNSGLSCTTPNLNAKAWYAFLGAFYDVVRLEYFAVRVFGNIGVGYDMMKDKFSRASYYANGTDYKMIYTINSNQTPSQEKGSVYIPFTAGVRFIIANNHGIEFIGKYNLMKSKWKGTQNLYNGEFDGYNTPRFISIDTKITRDYSWGIRYVYEFRND